MRYTMCGYFCQMLSANHFTGLLHGLATGMPMSTPTSRLPHDMEQLHAHTPTHPRQTSAHMHAPRHSLKLSFKHTRPCKVLLSAEERSQASFALALCSQHVQRCLSLAGGPTGPTDAQRDGREDVSKTTDGGCTQGQERLIRPKDL